MTHPFRRFGDLIYNPHGRIGRYLKEGLGLFRDSYNDLYIGEVRTDAAPSKPGPYALPTDEECLGAVVGLNYRKGNDDVSKH